MDLASYIKTHGDAACAARFKVKERTVASWRRGENFPRRKKAAEIVELTSGEVDMAGIYSKSDEANRTVDDIGSALPEAAA